MQLSAGKGMAALRLDAVLDVLSNSASQVLDWQRPKLQKTRGDGKEWGGRQQCSWGKTHSDEEGCGLVSWPQVLSFPLRLEEKRPRPGFSLVDAHCFSQWRPSAQLGSLCCIRRLQRQLSVPL